MPHGLCHNAANFMTATDQTKGTLEPREPYWVRKPAVTVSICVAALGILIFFVAVSFRFPRGLSHDELFRVAGVSMRPTINTGEFVLVQRDAYISQPPQRGDIVVFVRPNGRELFLKRIIAIGGDTISCTRDSTTVNGHKLYEPYLYGFHPGADNDSSKDSTEEVFGPVRVPPNSFFVMGDDRERSNDSRVPGFGCVPLDHIRGKAISAGSSRIQLLFSRWRQLH
jgi:signal peptidase I